MLKGNFAYSTIDEKNILTDIPSYLSVISGWFLYEAVNLIELLVIMLSANFYPQNLPLSNSVNAFVLS